MGSSTISPRISRSSSSKCGRSLGGDEFMWIHVNSQEKQLQVTPRIAVFLPYIFWVFRIFFCWKSGLKVNVKCMDPEIFFCWTFYFQIIWLDGNQQFFFDHLRYRYHGGTYAKKNGPWWISYRNFIPWKTGVGHCWILMGWALLGSK